MASNKSIPGKLITVSLGSNGEVFRCQNDAVLNIEYSVTANPVCKPDPSLPYKGVSWQTNTTESATWNISFSLNATDYEDRNQNSLLETLINTGNGATIVFETSKATGTGLDFSSIFEGDGQINSFSWTAPSEGVSTVDVAVTGDGEPTFITVPVAP